MIRRSRGTRYPATTRSTGSDTDELQTDVMRFMSILGLCLMAVFALVQSIPVQDQERVRSQPELDQLQQAALASGGPVPGTLLDGSPATVALGAKPGGAA